MSDVSRPPINPYAPPRSKLVAHDFSEGRWAVGYASFWRRFAATMIDSVLISATLLVYVFALAALAVAVAPAREPGPTMVIVFIVGYGVAILASIAYPVMMECSSAQATLGKSAVGIKVTDENGERISFGRSLGRHFGKAISSILMIGFLMPAFTEKKQALHDLMAGTLVLKVK